MASTHAYVLVFTDRGRVYWLKVSRDPEVGRAAKGKAIVNSSSLEHDENVAALLAVGTSTRTPEYVVIARAGGKIKKTELAAFSNVRPSGIIAIDIDDGDGHRGGPVRWQERDLRRHAATAWPSASTSPTCADGPRRYGVRGITLREGDEVVGDGSRPRWRHPPHGRAERLRQAHRPGRLAVQNPRGGMGIINIQTYDRNGKVVGIAYVHDDDELMLISQQGMILRMKAGR